LLSRENLLEDVQYVKIAPNRFIVEVGEENYVRNYQPIEERVRQQWREKLLEHLAVTNSRLGRNEYRFGGPVQVEIRPETGLQNSQARIYARIQKESPVAVKPAETANGEVFLEMLPDGRRWSLQEGLTVIGRDETCDIYLDSPEVQERRFISNQHAFIRCESRGCFLYDGSPAGKPSVNGTYLNFQRVGGQGVLLHNGDMIILSSLDPQNPRSDTPGAVTFRFWSTWKD